VIHAALHEKAAAMTSGSAASIGFVGTFPPTQCGIATFTAALADSMSPPGCNRRIGVVEVVGPNDGMQPLRGPIVAQWHHGNELSLRRAVYALETFDAVVVQHEFGIFGGPDGEEVTALLERLTVPIVAVLHTIVASPSPNQKRVLERIVDATDRSIVMTHAARGRLINCYDIDPRKIGVIPHGAHAPATAPPRPPRSRPIILTWGLLGPGKGIELAIDAVAALRDLVPTSRYIIAGQTHPKVLATSGEAYRKGLVIRVERADVNHIVEFDDSYRNLTQLSQLIATADVVVLPYESRDQVTSGVLIEAVAAGKPVVATAFPHAVELLASGAGLVVPHQNANAIGTAVRSILTNPNIASNMRAHANRIGPDLLWPRVGAQFSQVIASILLPMVPTGSANQFL
jgi:polysaccharide biosynthesis protein PslF